MKIDFAEFSTGGGGKRSSWKRLDFFKRPAPVGAADDATRVVRTGAIAAASFFGLLILFALTVPISGAAVATGEVTTSGSRIVVQPLAGGLVSEVLVSEGQSVREGQPLVRLNGVRSAARARQAQSRRDALRALQARLIAERDDQDVIAFPHDLTRRANDPVVADALASQSAIFRQNQQIRVAELELLRTQEGSATALRTSSARQLELLRDELGRYRELYDRGYARVSQVRSLERSEAQLIGDMQAGTASVASAQLELARTAADQGRETLQQLSEVESQLAQVDPDLQVTRFDAARDTLRAPASGRISGMTRIGPGTVLSPGTTIMEVVPDGRALIIEALVRPEDIDDVTVGSPATLRFTTVNPRGQSSFEGKVITLSPARLPGQESSGQFRAQIMIADPTALSRNNMQIQSGLPVVVQIKTTDRTLFNYLFAPVGDAMSGAFREE